MAVFRVERNKGYTVMSNHHLRNKELSLKAKGLLSQMLSLPEDWDYTLKGLTWKSTLNAAPPLSSPTRFLTITRLTQQTYRRTQTMRKRSAEEKQKQLERFLMNVAEAADAALWEYWREKEAEHRRFATEYVTRRGLIPQQ